VINVDLSGVTGVGSSTQAQYVVSITEVVQRPAVASDTVDITFPFVGSGATDSYSAQTGVVSFALSFNLNTGAVTSATASVGSPDFPQ
jgi:hypothetical protein